MFAEHEITITVKPRLFKKQLPIRFDMLAFFSVLEEFGIGLNEDISEIGKIPYDEMICVAIYAGHKSYCFEHDNKMVARKEVILKWVDESIVTRKHLKEINAMWLDFIKDYTEKKKVKADG